MEDVIDLNCDMGESFGPYILGMDEDMLELVSSANVACGFHAGDPRVMERTVCRAAERGVGIGAHVGFPDLVGEPAAAGRPARGGRHRPLLRGRVRPLRPAGDVLR